MNFFRDFVPYSTPLPGHDPWGRAQGRLNLGDSLSSATGSFKLIMQSDGNLVLYGVDDRTQEYTKVMWASNTKGSDPKGKGFACLMQDDGNVVVIDLFLTAIFSFHTQGHPGAFLRCQDDGNLVVYGSDGAVLKFTNTQAGDRGGSTGGGLIPTPTTSPPPSGGDVGGGDFGGGGDASTGHIGGDAGDGDAGGDFGA